MTEIKYLTVQEVATLFRRSTKTIYRWIEEGDPIKEYTRVGGGVLIPESEIERILEEGRNKDISDLKPTKPPRQKKKGFVNNW